MGFDHTGTDASFAYYSVQIYRQRRERNVEIPSSQKLFGEKQDPTYQEGHDAGCRFKTHSTETVDCI